MRGNIKGLNKPCEHHFPVLPGWKNTQHQENKFTLNSITCFSSFNMLDVKLYSDSLKRVKKFGHPKTFSYIIKISC